MRLLERLEELYAIGGGRGANRPHGSVAEDAAHELAAGWMEEAGLAVERDAAGNLLGRYPGEGAELWAASHRALLPMHPTSSPRNTTTASGRDCGPIRSSASIAAATPSAPS